jgi:hypothetical protein
MEKPAASPALFFPAIELPLVADAGQKAFPWPFAGMEHGRQMARSACSWPMP